MSDDHAAKSQYQSQDRGEVSAYQRYLNGMDASMRQKVALTAAHFLCEGEVADMGMGSGTGTEALAKLYPRLSVTGVDINPTMVELANQRYQSDNLRFVSGDIAKKVLPENSLDGILSSSVLHHVTSFNDYDKDQATRAITAQVAQLKEHGVIIIRDFLAPPAGNVWLELPDNDGDNSDNPETCSTATLFLRFSREFRALSQAPGFEFTEITEAPSLPNSWRCFELEHRHAVEFILRKDYRSDWEAEVQEEYTYFTQPEFEDLLKHLGLRILASTPIYNDWIIKNRYQGKFLLANTKGLPIAFPPTNYLIAAEKVPQQHGLGFEEKNSGTPANFLQMAYYQHKESQQLYDLVRRPNLTVDIIPWFVVEKEVYVLAKMAYPRPILAACDPHAPSLDGSYIAHHVTEPLSLILSDKPIAQSVERLLTEQASIEPQDIIQFSQGMHYYPSPGGIQEEVRSVFVQITPRFEANLLKKAMGLSSTGRIRAINAKQVLRAAQVGGLPEARLELNVYQLLRQQQIVMDDWLGELPPALNRSATPEQSPLTNVDHAITRRYFTAVEQGADFLRIKRAKFRELNCRGQAVGGIDLEYVTPQQFSANTVSLLLLCQTDKGLLIALQDHDLPAAQCFSGHSNIYVAPAWRLPVSCTTMLETHQFIKQQLRKDFSIALSSIQRLGGRYHPSAGTTPEVVYPMLGTTLFTKPYPAHPKLKWFALPEVIAQLDKINDSHLKIGIWRLGHALDLL